MSTAMGRAHARRGSAIVETALAIPLLTLILMYAVGGPVAAASRTSVEKGIAEAGAYLPEGWESAVGNDEEAKAVLGELLAQDRLIDPERLTVETAHIEVEDDAETGRFAADDAVAAGAVTRQTSHVRVTGTVTYRLEGTGLTDPTGRERALTRTVDRTYEVYGKFEVS